MNGIPLSTFGTVSEPLVGIGDEVQAELDRHMASFRSLGLDNSRATLPVSPTTSLSETGVFVGALLGPFIYSLFVLVYQHIFARALMADSQYGLMLMGTLPYGLMLGVYLGARLPQLLEEGRWRFVTPWVALLGGLVLLGGIAYVSAVARLYLPFYAFPIVSLLWVETMGRCKK